MGAKERLAQALLSNLTPATVLPSTGPPTASLPGPPPDPINPEFLPNPQLEQTMQAQTGAAPLHPLVQAIMSHLGLLNLVRNRNNQSAVDPETPLQ